MPDVSEGRKVRLRIESRRVFLTSTIVNERLVVYASRSQHRVRECDGNSMISGRDGILNSVRYITSHLVVELVTVKCLVTPRDCLLQYLSTAEEL